MYDRKIKYYYILKIIFFLLPGSSESLIELDKAASFAAAFVNLCN